MSALLGARYFKAKYFGAQYLTALAAGTTGGGGGPKPKRHERWIPPDGRSREQDYQRFADQLAALESQPAKQTKVMAGFIDLGNPGILPAPVIHDDMGNLREIALALLADGFED